MSGHSPRRAARPHESVVIASWLSKETQKSCLTHSRPGRKSSRSTSGHSSTRPWIVTALRHRTSDTRKECARSVVSRLRVRADFSFHAVLPRSVSSGWERPGLIPSNIPGHRRWTSPRHRSVLHWASPGCHQPARCKRMPCDSSMVGGGCAPEEHVPRAAARTAVACLRPTGGPTRSARHRARTDEDERLLTKRLHREAVNKACWRVETLP